jgi:hypothetical protein
VLELQGAIVSRLKAYPSLTAMIGQRVYDEVPPSAEFPYVSLGPTDEIQNDAECIDASDIGIQIDVWSRATTGKPEMLRIAQEVKSALHLYETSLPSAALALLEHQITRGLVDPDGITKHAAMQFIATVEQP